jgi:hypothetical protein
LLALRLGAHLKPVFGGEDNGSFTEHIGARLPSEYLALIRSGAMNEYLVDAKKVATELAIHAIRHVCG